MVALKIVETLERVIRLTPDLHSILIFDKDGVPVVNAGDDFRNRSMLSSCYTSSIEQAKKLGMGHQKYWTFAYESHQIVMLSLEPFVVFLIAAPSANTGILCDLGDKLAPALKECEQVFRDVSAVSS